MTSKNWLRRSVLACGTSLFLWTTAGAQPAPPQKVPAVALVDSADAPQWETWTKSLGWKVIVVAGDAVPNSDQRVLGLAAAVAQAVKEAGVDPARVYVAGRAEAAALVFYAISRIPDRWAAGIAVGGTPKPALETNRIFAVNFTNTPVLWVSNGTDDEALAQKLKAGGMNLEWRAATGLSNDAIFQWLAGHTRDEAPATVDCETNSPTFASCYWIQPTKFDPAERNDVLPGTLVAGEAAPSLDLGGFGYRATDPGPGVSVAFLPEKYNGQLRAGDRLVALDGKPIENAHQFMDMLSKVAESRAAVVMVQRGKDRVRVETRILVPRRDPVTTARVQAHYLPEFRQIEIVSRAVTEMRLNIPEAWVPGDLFWNGLSLEGIKSAGCHMLKLEKELLRVSPCQ